MGKLSEKELLLLDNFMYIDGSTEVGKGKTLERVVDDILKKGISKKELSGDIKVEQAEDILNEIKKDPKLCRMTIEESIDTKGVRASCFVDEENQATVAFRGTGGSYEAWKDNVLGAYQVDTECQKMAAEFIQNNCANYNNITVTGHSKGGNMAQYCTVVCGNQIESCYSYDGQGFNDEFLDKYADEIAQNQRKITSICCNNDYVNILLKPIAGQTKYLLTEEDANAHLSWALYCKNKDLTDRNGTYTNLVEQSNFSKTLKQIMDELVENIDKLPEDTMGADVNLNMALKAIREEIQIEKQYMKTSREVLLNCMKCYQEAETRCMTQNVAIGN